MTTICYATHSLDPRSVRRVGILYRGALFCAIAPLIAGLGVLVAYWLSLRLGFAVAGFFVVPIGICLFLIGAAFWLTCVFYQSKAKRLNAVRPLARGRLLLAALLLLGNFPAAFGCVYVGTLLVQRIYVDVINETGALLDSCVVVVPGDRQECKTLAPGGRFRTHLYAGFDGTADVIVTQGGRTESIEASPYVCRGMHGNYRVHVKPGLASDVENLR